MKLGRQQCRKVLWGDGVVSDHKGAVNTNPGIKASPKGNDSPNTKRKSFRIHVCSEIQLLKIAMNNYYTITILFLLVLLLQSAGKSPTV